MIKWILQRSLRAQLVILLCMAMGSAAAMAIWQGFNSYERQTRRIEAQLMESARLSGEAQLSIFFAADQLLRALSGQRSIIEDQHPVCEHLLTRAVEKSRYYSHLASFSADGTLRCASFTAVDGLQVEDNLWFREVMAGKPFVISGLLYSSFSFGRAIVVAVPIISDDQKIAGALSLAVRLDALEEIGRRNMPQRSISVLLDRSGNLLASQHAPEYLTMQLPEPQLLRRQPAGIASTFSAVGKDGVRRMFAISPILGEEVQVLFGQPEADLFNMATVDLLRSILTPILIWLLVIVTIWIGIERLVLRWVSYLRRIAAIYARGRYSVRPVRTEDAPIEFRAMGRTFSRMADVIQQREQELQDSVEQKKVLLREIHHRVKNNLQIITSLLNLQSRQLKDDREIAVFEAAKNRINALALVHRSLYEAENLQSVDLKFFMEELCQQLLKTGWGAARRVSMEINVPSVIVPADTAVPIALLVTETVTNAFKHAFANRSSGNIYVSLESAGDQGAVLTIRDDGVGGMSLVKASEGRGIGRSLINAFARQLVGSASVSEDNGTVWKVTLPHLTIPPHTIQADENAAAEPSAWNRPNAPPQAVQKSRADEAAGP